MAYLETDLAGDSYQFLQEFCNEECCASCAVRMAEIWPVCGGHFLSTPSLDQHILSPHRHTHTYTDIHTQSHAQTQTGRVGEETFCYNR